VGVALGDRRDEVGLVYSYLEVRGFTLNFLSGLNDDRRDQAGEFGLHGKPEVALQTPAHVDLAGGLAFEEAAIIGTLGSLTG